MVEEQFEIKLISKKKIDDSKVVPIPREVTDQVLKSTKEVEKVEEANLISSSIDDYIVEEIRAGNVDEQKIIDKFYDSGIDQEINTQGDNLHPDNAKLPEFDESTEELNIVKENCVALLAECGVPIEKIEAFRSTELKVTNSAGMSTAGDNMVEISRGQIKRKAVDLEVLYPETEAPENYKALFVFTYAHELGHVVDNLMGMASNNAQYDWGDVQNTEESRPERLVEGLAHLVVPQEYSKMRLQDSRVHVIKASRMYRTVAEASNDGFNFRNVFRGILKRSAPDSYVHQLAQSRLGMYTQYPMENHALPYTGDRVKNTLRQSIK